MSGNTENFRRPESGMRQNRVCSRGFTLIELMIVIAILGVLMAIAIPSYRDYVKRGSLTDAATGLTSMRADMETYYQNFRTYAAGNGGTPPCLAGAKYGKFTVSCTGTYGQVNASGYRLQAVSTDNILKEYIFTVTQADVRSTENAPAKWTNTLPCPRWVLKSEAC